MNAPGDSRPAGGALLARFTAVFERPASVVVRAPGRVNLIGEHTDYNGLPVLPMAIDRSMRIAAAPRDDRTVRAVNVDRRFPPREYELSAVIPPFPPGDWGNYHKAAAQGLAGALGAGALHGGDFLIESDLPDGAGLSSSSALVVGSALALLAVNGRTMEPHALAELSATAERYVGTQSGGMDQAVCLLAEAGHALRIDFDPLRVRPVPIPAGYSIVVCHSLVAAEKSGAARQAYNSRVVECRLACAALECLLGARLPGPLVRLGDLRRLFPDRALGDFVALLENALPVRPLTLDELARRLGASRDRLAAAAGAGAASDTTYSVVKRARHVLTEAERVDRAERALAGADWLALSTLMDASHASCRDDYEVSSPALEELVAAAKTAGALGARLTGAGFGGCTVNLVRSTDTGLFLTMMERTFYHGNPEAVRRPDHAFAVIPSAGAAVHRVAEDA